MSEIIKYEYAQIPNYVLDHILPELKTVGEVKILLYILRRTIGFHQRWDFIAMSQFMTGITNHRGDILDEGTGLSKPTCRYALKNLQHLDLITCHLCCANPECDWHIDALEKLPRFCPKCHTAIYGNTNLRRIVGFTNRQWMYILVGKARG